MYTNRSNVECCWKIFGFVKNPNNGKQHQLSVNTKNNSIDGLQYKGLPEEIRKLQENNKTGRPTNITITDAELFAEICSKIDFGNLLLKSILVNKVVLFKSEDDLNKFFTKYLG